MAILRISDLGEQALQDHYMENDDRYEEEINPDTSRWSKIDLDRRSRIIKDFGVLFYFWNSGPKEQDYWATYNLSGQRRPVSDRSSGIGEEMTSGEVVRTIKKLRNLGYLEQAQDLVEETPTFGEPANGGLDELERHYDETPVYRGDWRELGHSTRRKQEAQRIKRGFGPVGRPPNAPEGPYGWNT